MMLKINKTQYFGSFPNYLSVKDGTLHFKDVNLLKLCKEHDVDDTALKVFDGDNIRDNITSYKEMAAQAIKETGYPNRFLYAYASKVNYSREVLLAAYHAADLVETSSPNDLMLYEELLKRGTVKTPLTIISNGPKSALYLDAIDRVSSIPGVRIIATVDSLYEYRLFADRKTSYELGLRLAPRTLTARVPEGADRFGFTREAMAPVLADLRTNSFLTLKMVTMHYSHIKDMTDVWLEAVSHLVSDWYVPLHMEFPSLDALDLGGGLPSNGYKRNDFDYALFPKRLFATIKASLGTDTRAPLVIGEYGRYTASDSEFILAKVNYVQSFDAKDIYYNMNASIMIYMADSWSFLDDYMILPVNLIDNDFQEVKVAGPTCDPGDLYHYRRSDQYCPLPVIKPGEELYLAIFTAGCYQNNVSGFGGAHHCLIPEGPVIEIKTEKGVSTVKEIVPRQTIADIMARLHY